jgi:hypothetical protein
MWQWNAGALFLVVYLFATTPALPETSREVAEVVAAMLGRATSR